MVATGRRIKELRDNAGMSTRDIADVFGFQNQTAVFKWMKGASLPTVDNLVILADLFGVTIEEILVIRKNENTAHVTPQRGITSNRSVRPITYVA